MAGRSSRVVNYLPRIAGRPTAHFGHWEQAVRANRRHWAVEARLLYAQVIKRYKRRRLAGVHQRVCLGSADDYRQALHAQGLSGRIHTAFIDRLKSLAPPTRAGVPIRRTIVGLARR